MAKRIIALALVLCLTLCFFASCGSTLSGTYKTAEVFGSYTSLKFSGSKVTIKAYVAGAEVTSAEADYAIKDGTITVTVTNGESAISGDLAFEKNDDGSIKIGLLTFTKQ